MNVIHVPARQEFGIPVTTREAREGKKREMGEMLTHLPLCPASHPQASVSARQSQIGQKPVIRQNTANDPKAVGVAVALILDGAGARVWRQTGAARRWTRSIRSLVLRTVPYLASMQRADRRSILSFARLWYE